MGLNPYDRHGAEELVMRPEDAAGKVRAASLTVVPVEGQGGWACFIGSVRRLRSGLCTPVPTGAVTTP